jgi:hypothetical protein
MARARGAARDVTTGCWGVESRCGRVSKLASGLGRLDAGKAERPGAGAGLGSLQVERKAKELGRGVELGGCWLAQAWRERVWAVGGRELRGFVLGETRRGGRGAWRSELGAGLGNRAAGSLARGSGSRQGRARGGGLL